MTPRRLQPDSDLPVLVLGVTLEDARVTAVSIPDGPTRLVSLRSLDRARGVQVRELVVSDAVQRHEQHAAARRLLAPCVVAGPVATPGE